MSTKQQGRRKEGRFARIVAVIFFIAALAEIVGIYSLYVDLQESKIEQTRIASEQATGDARAEIVFAQATQDIQANGTIIAVLQQQQALQIKVATEQASGIDAEEARMLRATATALKTNLDAAFATLDRTMQEIPPVNISESTPTPSNTPTPTDIPTPRNTSTATPTHTPSSTSTPTHTPTPTITPTPTPTPTVPPEPGTVLFSDDFETGFDKDIWEVISGDPFVVGGRLTSNGEMWIVADVGWPNYIISFDVSGVVCRGSATPNSEDWTQLMVRYENLENRLILHAGCGYHWRIVSDGNGQNIAHSDSSTPPKIEGFLHIEATVQNNQFSVKDGETIFRDDIGNGTKIGIRTEGNQIIDNVTIIALP